MSSCDPDDEYYGNPLVGTWQMVAPLDGFYNEFTFYADGSGTYYVEDDWGRDNYYINWYLYGNQLQVDFPDQMDTMYFTCQVSGYSLYLYPSDGGTPWVYQLY
ncbi:MAG: hypothetical protein NC339_04910 [Muribaculaceae bacterium]|nr:hypothetical protein [Muribaculaceae bacterium]